jgi:hypothetical protein
MEKKNKAIYMQNPTFSFKLTIPEFFAPWPKSSPERGHIWGHQHLQVGGACLGHVT